MCVHVCVCGWQNSCVHLWHHLVSWLHGLWTSQLAFLHFTFCIAATNVDFKLFVCCFATLQLVYVLHLYSPRSNHYNDNVTCGLVNAAVVVRVATYMGRCCIINHNNNLLRRLSSHKPTFAVEKTSENINFRSHVTFGVSVRGNKTKGRAKKIKKIEYYKSSSINSPLFS